MQQVLAGNVATQIYFHVRIGVVMRRIADAKAQKLMCRTVSPAFGSIMPRANSCATSFANADTFDFVTLRCLNLRSPWKEAASKQRLLSKLKAAKKCLGLSVAAYVVLDDHAHFLLRAPQGHAGDALMEELRLGFFEGCEKGDALHDQDADARPKLEYRALTGPMQTRAHLDFIHYEPVLHGLVDRAVDYDWSSFPTRVAQGHYPENWAAYTPPATLTRVHL